MEQYISSYFHLQDKAVYPNETKVRFLIFGFAFGDKKGKQSEEIEVRNIVKG